MQILGQEEIKPHKVRYYLERRDAEFEHKMAEVLCVYREVQVLKKAAAKAEKSKKSEKPVAIVSFDEKPGIQAIATTAPDLPPVPGVHPTFARDHESRGPSLLIEFSSRRQDNGPRPYSGVSFCFSHQTFSAGSGAPADGICTIASLITASVCSARLRYGRYRRRRPQLAV